MGSCSKSVDIQELPRLVGIGDISCDSSKGSIIIRPTRPDLEAK